MKANRSLPFRHSRRSTRAALLCLLALPITVGTSAQTGLQWRTPSGTVPTTDTRPATVNLPPLQVQGVIPVRPLAAGFNVAEFEQIAQNLVAAQKVPGLAMAIVQNGRVLTARGYGITDMRNAEAVDAHTVFRLASLSKSFAGTVTGMLVAEGALRWDSKIADYMPSLRFSNPEAAANLTVADVLSHRVGLSQHNAFDRDIEANADYRSVVQKLAYAPMKCQPGDCYAYQNVAFSLIGDVVYGSSGQFYGEAVSRRIFKPLGMNDASVGLEGIQASPRWAKPHVRARGGWASVSPKPTYYRVAPAAGVNASISDMAQWLVAQTGHRPDVLPPSLLATLQSPIVATPGEMRSSSWRRERLTGAGYGLGWRAYDYAGQRVVFHGGAVQGYRGAVALVPGHDLGIALLWNGESAAPTGLVPTILDRAMGLPYHAWIQDAGNPALPFGTDPQLFGSGAPPEAAPE